MTLISETLRKLFYDGDVKRDYGLTTPNDIYRYNDIIYGEDPYYQSLDIYTPLDKKDEKLPTIISVHGGAFVYGTKETYQFYCMNLAQRGFKVVNFSYRLAPENKYPSQIEDTNTVFTWVNENADTYNLDLDNLFAVGDSAGANLLGIYAGLLEKPDLEEKYQYDFITPNLELKAIALNCGLFNPEKQNPLKDGTLTLDAMIEVLPKEDRGKYKRRLNVLNYVSKEYPPTFFMTSKEDFLNGQPKYLLEALRKRDIPFIYRFFSSRKRHLGHVFHLDIKLPEATICNDEEINFFREFIN